MELLDHAALSTAYGDQLAVKISQKLSQINDLFLEVYTEAGNGTDDLLSLPTSDGFKIFDIKSEVVTSTTTIKPFEAHSQANLRGVVLACEFQFENQGPYFLGVSSHKKRYALLRMQLPGSIHARAGARDDLSLIDMETKGFSPFHVFWTPKQCTWMTPSLEELRANCVIVAHKNDAEEERQYVLLPAFHPIVRYFYESFSRTGIQHLINEGHISSVRSFVQRFEQFDKDFVMRMPLQTFEVICEYMHNQLNNEMPQLERLGDFAVSLIPKKQDPAALRFSIRVLMLTRTEAAAKKPFVLCPKNAPYFQCIKGNGEQQLPFYDCLNPCDNDYMRVYNTAMPFYYGYAMEPQRVKRENHVKSEHYKTQLYVKESRLLN